MKKNNSLWLVVEISRLLNTHHCTYTQAEQVLKILYDELQQQRNDIDVEIIVDGNNYRIINHHVSDDKTVQALNHFEPYC